jgi:hypothetical protein
MTPPAGAIGIHLGDDRRNHPYPLLVNLYRSRRTPQKAGPSSWRLDRNHARRCEYAVCTRNAHANWVEGSEDHQAAFLVGRVKDVVQSRDHEGRWLVEFSEYALYNMPNVWKGDRNPVRYETMADLGIDPLSLKFEPMPQPQPQPEIDDSIPEDDRRPTIRPITLAEAKKGLALTFGVAPEVVEMGSPADLFKTAR